MSNEDRDFRSELEDWIDVWNDMEKEGHVEKPEPLQPVEDTNSPQDYYYDYLEDEMLMFQEEEKVQNPIYPDSVGPDDQQPKPVWVDKNLLKEVETLKNKMYKVECEMARMGQPKKFTEKVVSDKSPKLMEEIKRLRERIERVSSQLGIKNEPSPYRVKKA